MKKTRMKRGTRNAIAAPPTRSLMLLLLTPTHTLARWN
jgi:hypothetical protein